VTFNKQNVDEDSEGLDVAFYLSNQAGDLRGIKKFNGANFPDGDDRSKLDKALIKSIKLIMNNGTGFNYTPAMNHRDMGIIRVTISKKVSLGATRDISF